MLARRDRLRNLDDAVLLVRVFGGHHGICIRGQRGTCHHAHRVARGNRAIERSRRKCLATHRKRQRVVFVRARSLVAAQRVAIHRNAIEGGDVDCRHHRVRKHAIPRHVHRNAFYAEAFGASLAEPVTPPRLWMPAHLAQRLEGRRIIAVGSGGAMLAAAVVAAGGEAVAMLPGLQPHARQLALRADTAPVARSLDPLYLRDTDAKPMPVRSPT